jgi:hypothetical protein
LQVVTTQPLDFYFEGADSEIDLAFAAPHVHVTAISLTLQDAVTNETLCSVHRGTAGGAGGGGVVADGMFYGHGDAAGDEDGYLVGLTPCSWGGPVGTAGPGFARRYNRSHPMRSTAVYNATSHQTGVMALWLMNAAQVLEEEACAVAVRASGCLAQPNATACVRCCTSSEAMIKGLVNSGCGDPWLQGPVSDACAAAS